MKRMIASRRLKRTCYKCGCNFKKGNVYYINRKVFIEDYQVFAYEEIECPKCKFYKEQSEKRYLQFKERCVHPKQFRDEVWSYIPGEAVMQPDHDVCLLCGEWV